MRPVPDVTSNGSSLGAIIRGRRTGANLRVEDLAYKTRLAAKTIVRVEAGLDVRLSTLDRIAEALDTTTWELLHAAGQPTSRRKKAS